MKSILKVVSRLMVSLLVVSSFNGCSSKKFAELDSQEQVAYIKEHSNRGSRSFCRDTNGRNINSFSKEVQLELAIEYNDCGSLVYIEDPSAELIIRITNWENTRRATSNLWKVLKNAKSETLQNKKVQLALLNHDHALYWFRDFLNDQLIFDKQVLLAVDKIQYEIKQSDYVYFKNSVYYIAYTIEPSKKEQVSLISEYGKLIQYIKYPDTELQLAAVKSDPDSIYLIRNPSIEAKLLALGYIKQEVSKLPEVEYKTGYKYWENKEYKKAAYWFEQSAKEGHREAQYYLGMLYHEGNGVKQDYTKAVKWFQKSANQNKVDAQYFLAQYFEEGKGVDRDYIKSAFYYEKAAEDNILGAKEKACEMYYEAKEYNKSFSCYQKEANKGNVNAIFNLGVFYSKGLGTSQDKFKAYKYYMKAAKKGDEGAQKNLDSLCKQSPWACK